MTNRIVVALLLCAVLAIPGFAQQGNEQPSGSNASPGSTSREPLRPVTSGDFWDGDEPNVVNLIRHPFASKKYVRRQTEPIRDRLNELEQLTAENTKAVKDVDASAQHGIQLASEKTSLADQHATEATSQAQAAQTAATLTTTRVSSAEQMVGNVDQYKGATQTEIRFRPGQTALTKQAKEALDQIATPLKDQHNYIIEVDGYAAGSGQAAIANSRMMASSVMRYLMANHQIPLYRIYTLGLGNAPEPAQGAAARHTSGGRVEVNVLKNDTSSSAQH